MWDVIGYPCHTCVQHAYANTSPQYFWDVTTYHIYACRWKYTTSSMSFWTSHSSIGRVFRSPLRWRWKMAALPLPVAILDDLISGSRKWGHPRWRPEAEGPPFSTSTSLGIEKRAPGPGWRHFRPRHLGSKMATAAMTSGGRRDAREDVLQTSAPSMSPVEVWLYLDLKSIWSLASPRHYPSDWVSCPLATTRKWSVCTCRKLWKTFDFSKHLLYFFWILFYFIF